MGKTAGMAEATGDGRQPVGSLRRARQVFSKEVTRLGVTLDERAALDGLLDEMTEQFGISRQTLVRSYISTTARCGSWPVGRLQRDRCRLRAKWSPRIIRRQPPGLLRYETT